jgi:CPA2 family monovalent cation:H+ antiporter-2
MLTINPAMPEHHTVLPYLRETLLFLALAGILIPLLQRYRVNQILGFLAVGVLVGPFGLWLWVGQLPWLSPLTFMRVEGAVALGELGVLFLMFTIGLELSIERLWTLRRWVFGAGSAQVLLTATVIGSLAALFGNKAETAVIIGLMLSLSSTAVVMQLMTERQLLDKPVGQANFSILMLQDLAVVPILILVGILAKGEAGQILPILGMVLFKSIAAIVLITLLGRRVIRPLFKALAQQHQPATFMALILLATLGIAALTSYAGLSMALGAFLAGLLLAETEFRHEVEVTIEPFKSLLLGLFFMAVGMQTDLRVILVSPLWIALSVIGLFAIKAVVMALILKAGRLSWGHAIEGGLLMGQGGEFAFIVTGYALTSQLIAPAAAQFVLLVVALSMFATPLLARGGHMLGNWWGKTYRSIPAALVDATPAPMQGHVIIVGFGRIGQLMAKILTGQGLRYVAIENNMHLSTRCHPMGEPVYFGDVSRPELLHRVHASAAAAIVLTMDHPDAALHAALAIRREFSNVPLFARAKDEHHARALKKAGADLVTPEALEAGLQLSAFVLHAMGISAEKTADAIRNERDERISSILNK